MINYSQDLLKWYVNTSIKLYGPLFETYNIHSLIHLPNGVSYFKDNFDNISAFRFENHLKTLKSMIRNLNSPFAQIVKKSVRKRNSWWYEVQKKNRNKSFSKRKR